MSDPIHDDLDAGQCKLCEDCPPLDYPTNDTRCSVCPRHTLPRPAVDALGAGDEQKKQIEKWALQSGLWVENALGSSWSRNVNADTLTLFATLVYTAGKAAQFKAGAEWMRKQALSVCDKEEVRHSNAPTVDDYYSCDSARASACESAADEIRAINIDSAIAQGGGSNGY